ncbi:hypothetical protein GO684_03660 [Wolbachia endosymbiont of Litomosoides brasiliensis]|nr:hypothetical protein [Wolbachia endosymbiont of Litomosoides brasiliensis]NUY39743.1 hypothetical protein [Wolbachia endosymbiont of Litomosoides brasiliensis]
MLISVGWRRVVGIVEVGAVMGTIIGLRLGFTALLPLVIVADFQLC